jgi:hypothetical protein
MIQYVDAALEQRLERRRRVRVASDAHVSTGLSKPSLLNWPRYAKRQVRRYKPRVTVMFIGANDGFPMAGRSGRSRGGPGAGVPPPTAQFARAEPRAQRAVLPSG